MSVLSGLEPASVFGYFEEICSIPHGSRDTKKISDYLAGFAKDRGLFCIQDEANNIIIRKPGSAGRESEPTVIIQGHMDMVCEKELDCDIDFTTDGLRLMIVDGMITADGTTLGGDDGIAVAYALAILDSDTISHPPLEVVITVDEEIGMLGAAALDMSLLKGRRFLNIDSEDEGHLLVSCAGGATAAMHFPVSRETAAGDVYKIGVSGLVGGHSGVEIHKGRANADIVLAGILKSALAADDGMRIISLQGGLKDNAIPVRSEALIVSDKEAEIKNAVNLVFTELKQKYADTDPDMDIVVEKADAAEMLPLDAACNKAFIEAFNKVPDGVIAMSEDIEGLVQTSLNLGIMTTAESEITLSFCVRSSVNAEKDELLDRLAGIVRDFGGDLSIDGEYPAWEYRKDSQLRYVMTSLYEEMFNKPMVVEAIHAGVECGLFADALEGLDAVSFGPDIHDIHTPKEALDIASVQRTWEYLLKVLEWHSGTGSE